MDSRSVTIPQSYLKNNARGLNTRTNHAEFALIDSRCTGYTLTSAAIFTKSIVDEKKAATACFLTRVTNGVRQQTSGNGYTSSGLSRNLNPARTVLSVPYVHRRLETRVLVQIHPHAIRGIRENGRFHERS